MTQDLHLGALDGPVLIFGGPYSNLEATRALLAKTQALGIPSERTICTGDVVAYCAAPQECVDLIAAANLPVVMGNCEESLGAGSVDCGCGFDPGGTCDRLAADWYSYASRHLDQTARRWMRGLPSRITLEIAGRRLAVVHGAASEINRFVFASTEWREKRLEIETTGCDGVICGHSGLPFTQLQDDQLWHNAGVIGLPANDGTPRTWFSTLTPRPEGILIEHHALVYEAGSAAAAMRSEGLPEEYAEALVTGLWDNCEILPDRETAARGVPLAPPPILWRTAEKQHTAAA